MDALEFLEEYKRMCDQVDCEDCPLHSDGGCDTPIIFSKPMYSLRECVAAVEQWSKEHPRKTRQSEFLARWPAARLDDRGVLDILPCQMNPIQYRTPAGTCATGMMCMDCRKKYWMQEVDKRFSELYDELKGDGNE